MNVMLTSGQKAPDFSLSDQDGKTVKLSAFQGRRVLLYFYPKADTPGCTTQSCAVRDARQDMKKLKVEVLGISPDAPEDQKKFDVKFSLGFPLLADHDTRSPMRTGSGVKRRTTARRTWASSDHRFSWTKRASSCASGTR